MLIHSTFENTVLYQEEVPAYLRLIKVELSILSTGEFYLEFQRTGQYVHTCTEYMFVYTCTHACLSTGQS